MVKPLMLTILPDDAAFALTRLRTAIAGLEDADALDMLVVGAKVYGPLDGSSVIVIGGLVTPRQLRAFRQSLYNLWTREGAERPGTPPIVINAEATILDVSSDKAATAVAREREKYEKRLADAEPLLRAVEWYGQRDRARVSSPELAAQLEMTEGEREALVDAQDRVREIVGAPSWFEGTVPVNTCIGCGRWVLYSRRAAGLRTCFGCEKLSEMAGPAEKVHAIDCDMGEDCTCG